MNPVQNLSLILIILFAVPIWLGAQTDCVTDIDNKSDTELGRLLELCEQEIEQEKGKLIETERQSTTLEAGIAELDYKITKSNLEIRASNIRISTLSKDITEREFKIENLNEKIVRMKVSLSALIRKTREFDDFSAVEAVLSNQQLSEFFIDIDDFDVINGNLQLAVAEIRGVRENTNDEKDALEVGRASEKTQKYLVEKEKRNTELYKDEKEDILAITKGQELRYKEIIAEKEKIKNQIRNRVFRTVGGDELTFGEALAIVEKYENRISIHPALVLAVLTQESSVDGLIGKNIGKCFYDQAANNSAGTVMSNSQKPSFLALTNELGINPSRTPVSCPIYSDGAYGGAMGGAQFMPNTWWNITTQTGYKKRVAKVTGNPLPSPFVNEEAFVGTMLYLRDGLDRCLTAFSSTFELRACTAAKYYSGLGSRGARLSRHMDTRYSYGYQVALRAAQFQKDIDTLSL